MPKLFSFGTDTSPTLTDNVPTLDAESGTNKKTTLQKIWDLFRAAGHTHGSASQGGALANDSVTALMLDWASTGPDAGIWWEELGRTTLGSAADTISVASFPARKYLYLMASLIDTGGTIGVAATFNSDTGNNYAVRESNNGGADATGTSQANAGLLAAVAAPAFIVSRIINIAAQEKLMITHNIGRGTAGAANAPSRSERTHKWANTSNQITTVLFTNTGTGDYATGSEVLILGHN